MSRLTLTPGLTRGDDKFESHIADTCPGQAHLAGEGPAGATCGDCIFLVRLQQRAGLRCKKFYDFANKVGPVVPASALACKHFEKRKDDQPEPARSASTASRSAS